MNCANIWGPSDHSGRFQRPKPLKDLYKSRVNFTPLLCSRVYILYLNTEHNYPVEIRDRCTPAHPSAYSREKLTPMFTTFLGNYILFFFGDEYWMNETL